MKIKCWNCGHEFEGGISKDELGWHSYCEECNTSFDVDVPSGRIVMAFTDPVDDAEDDGNRYRYFTDDFTGDYVHTYYAFDTVEDFIKKWVEIYDEPNGMWYWVLDNGELVCSGACDPYDIEIFIDNWEEDKEMIVDIANKFGFDMPF